VVLGVRITLNQALNCIRNIVYSDIVRFPCGSTALLLKLITFIHQNVINFNNNR